MIEQGTPEWFEQRRGKVTGSMITAVLAEKSQSEATTRRNYRYQLALERITGVVLPNNLNTVEMQAGKDNEYIARGTYEGENGVMVEEVSFVDHPTIEWLGISPDGRVPGGLVEIKCPKPAIHMDYMLTEEIPYEYRAQMTLQMLCTGEKWCDFVSFCPLMPDALKYMCLRYYPQPALVSEITIKTIKFLAEVKALVTDMENMIKDRT